MLNVEKKIVRDRRKQPIAVQINYADWLKIERLLNLQDTPKKIIDLSIYAGIIQLGEDPLDYQKRIRSEWE